MASAGAGPGVTGGAAVVKVDLVINQNYEKTLHDGRATDGFVQQLLEDVSAALKVERRRLECVGLHAGSIRAQIAISNDPQALRSAESLGQELVAQAHDPHSLLRQLQPHVVSARMWMNSGFDEEDEEALEAEEEARMDFLAHGAQGRGRTSDSIAAIDEQQQAIRDRYNAIQASGRAAVPPDLARSVANVVQGHVDDLQAHKTRPHKGMAAVDLRHELDRLEQRNAVMVQTCLGLYQQLASGGKNNVVEDLKRQIADAEVAHRRHEQLFKDGISNLQDKFKEAQAQLVRKSKEAMELRTAYDVETSKLRNEKHAMEVRMQGRIDLLTTRLEQDSEFQKLREEIDKLLVLQTSTAAQKSGEDAIGHLQAQLKKAHAARYYEMGSGAQTEAEKERMAVGGLVTEVEVLSLTNAQLVLDLHRLRKERYEFEELATATQEKNRMMQQQLDELLPSKSALEQQCQMLADKAKGLETELNQRKHLKTPSGKWVAFSMLVSRRDLDAELEERRAEFEEWMHSRREALERELRGKEQYLLDRIDDKEREIADLRQELRDQVQLKEKGLTELAEMQSKRRLHEEKCQSEVSAAKTEVDLAKRTIKDLEAQVCARLRVGLFCHNVGLFCPIM